MKWFLIFILNLVCFISNSQNNDSFTELDTKYTPNSNSMFNNSVKRNAGPSDGLFENRVKFNATMLVRKKVYFSYERQLFSGIYITAGIGKPFGEDILVKMASELYFDTESGVLFAGSSLTENKIYNNSTYYGSGAILSAGLKGYFNNPDWDNLKHVKAFVELNYRRERVDYILNPLVNSRTTIGENVASFTYNVYSLAIGLSALSGPNKNFTHDIFFRGSITSVSYTNFEDQHSYSNPNFTYKISTVSPLISKIHIGFGFGYYFGFGF